MQAIKGERGSLEVRTGQSGMVTKSHGATRAQPGDCLPAVSLPATTGGSIDLSDLARSKHLVIFFYPGDLEGLRYPELTGCTPEACSFRDSIGELRALGAEIVGASMQSSSRQRSFAEREHLNFPVLSDEVGELINGLGVPTWASEYGEIFVSRTTIIVKKGGAIAHVFDDVQVDQHVSEVIAIVEALND